MKTVTPLPGWGGPITPPLEYTQPAVNGKLVKPTPQTMEADVTWALVVKGEHPHMEKTVCCNKGCRINDIIVIVPVAKLNKIVGQSFVHAGCLRSFLEDVPEELNVVKERVSEIKDKFIVE